MLGLEIIRDAPLDPIVKVSLWTVEDFMNFEYSNKI